MHRSNPIGLVFGLLFLTAMVIVYLWSHQAPSRVQTWGTEAWIGAFTVAGFYLWWHGMRLRMLIEGIPTSRIVSAPQGYVELAGRAKSAKRHFSDASEFYLWKRTEFASRSGFSNARSFPFNLFYTTTSIEVTETPFCIDDGSGQAFIVPAGAEVICSRREVQYLGDDKVIRESILDGDPLYVLGSFVTTQQGVDIVALTEQLVNDWKMDKEQLKRFDTNGDGYLWGRELMALHREARRVAEERAADSAGTQGVHLVSSPADGRRFVISNFAAEKLAGHYRWYLALGLAMFFTGVGGAISFFRAYLSAA
jgi:hypothetical protein